MKKSETIVEDLGDDAAPSSLAGKMSGMLSGGGSVSARINFNDIDMSKVSTGFELLPEDTDLEFVIDGVKPDKSKSGNSMLVITLKCAEPDTNAKIVDYVTYTGDNPWKFKSLCQAAGLLSEDGASFTGTDETDFMKVHVFARVQHETYQGVKRNKIKGGYKSIDDDDDEVKRSDSNDPNF